MIRTRVNASSSNLLVGVRTMSRQSNICLSSSTPFSFVKSKLMCSPFVRLGNNQLMAALITPRPPDTKVKLPWLQPFPSKRRRYRGGALLESLGEVVFYWLWRMFFHLHGFGGFHCSLLEITYRIS